MTGDLLTAALEAAERGWHVFPLRPGTKRPALHGEHACPGTGPCAGGHRKWEARATNDPDRIRTAWSRAPFNVGIATGPSGLLVVDLDTPEHKGSSDAPDGATTFGALCERAGHAVPDTYRTRTPSAAGTCTSLPRPATAWPTPRAPLPIRSTPARGADTSSPPAVSRPPDATKRCAAAWRPLCPNGCTPS